MKNCIPFVAVLSLAALVPIEGRAGVIFSDVELTAFTEVTTQGLPRANDFDSKIVPIDSLGSVQALSVAPGIPFPNVPNSVGTAFASSAQLSDTFGVGVNGFFFRNSLPPNTLLASGTFSHTLTNDSAVTERVLADFFVPTPTLQFFGVGNSFPGGVDPARDASAAVSMRMLTKVIHPDGSTVETVHLDYGMRTFRVPELPGVPGSGALLPVPSRDAVGLTRFDEPDGSFGFQLPELDIENFRLPDLGPGDVMEFSYDFFATASTGFGETGIFAAIGDPFDLSAGGGRFTLQVGDPVGPAPGSGSIPEPSTLALLGLTFLLMRASARRGRRPSGTLHKALGQSL